MEKKLLITGGAGFIGSNLLAALQPYTDEYEIVVCDELGTDNKWQNLKNHYVDDLIDPAQLPSWLDIHADQVNTIFHLGAISTTTERDADLIAESNFRLSRHLWQWCCCYDKRLIYASSAATYGDGARGFVDDESPEHLATYTALNAYGWSKHAFDRFVARQIAEEKGTPAQWAGLKFFNVYGPNEYHKGGQRSVIAALFDQINAGAPAKLFKSYNPKYPDGGQLRDFVYIDDVCNVMEWLFENPAVNGLFNVGTGKARSFEDLARATFTALDKEPNIEFIEMPEGLREQYQYFTEAPLNKLRAAGYSQEFMSLEDGAKEYVQGYLTKGDSYK